MYIRQLGAPTWVVRALGMVHRVGMPGGYTGGVPSSPPTSRGAVPVQRSGPRKAHRAWSGWYWGCGRNGGRDGSWDHLRPGRSTLWPSLSQDPQNAHLGPIGRDSINYSVKLVKTAKCHRFMSKRPTIVPVSKNGSRNHLLKFSDFHIWQPSLPRN